MGRRETARDLSPPDGRELLGRLGGPSPHLIPPRNTSEAPALVGDGVRGDGLQSLTGLTAGSHGNGGTRRQELAQPLPTGSLQPPNILILTPVCPVGAGGGWWGDKGTLGSWTQPQFSHLLLRKCSKSVPFGGPPGSRKESDYSMARPHPNPQAQALPPGPVPAGRKLGRENGSKRREKDSGPVMSTGRPRAPRFSLLGPRPPDCARETPRKCPGHTGALGAWGGRAGPELGVGVRTRP